GLERPRAESADRADEQVEAALQLLDPSHGVPQALLRRGVYVQVARRSRPVVDGIARAVPADRHYVRAVDPHVAARQLHSYLPAQAGGGADDQCGPRTTAEPLLA